MTIDHQPTSGTPAVSPRDAGRRPAYVYRAYEAEHRLIYIGSTANLWQRFATHRLQSWWAHTAVRVRAEVHPTAEDARRVEHAAILAEKPRWNRYEIRAGSLLLPQGQFYDYVYGRVAWLLANPAHMRDHHHDWLAKYQRVYQHRFGVPLGIGFDTLDLYANPVPTFETALGSPTPAPAPSPGTTGDLR